MSRAKRGTVIDDARIEELVKYYEQERHHFTSVVRNLSESFADYPKLKKLLHSVKARTKDPAHLRDKLQRKQAIERSEAFDCTRDTLFDRIMDLGGVRLIHLHTSQFPQIDEALREVLADHSYKIFEGPTANTWDEEYEQLFKGWKAQARSQGGTMYTSVHYVVERVSKKPIRCELQVRTLMEEVWGEVSHTVNYPHPSNDESVKEQLKVLARFTSGCTRLVDTIFLTHGRSVPPAADGQVT